MTTPTTSIDNADHDPLAGYSPDDIIVGPGGQTIAHATDADLAPGWEQRAVDRARAEGLLGADPLAGYSPDEIVVGPDGQTLAAIKLNADTITNDDIFALRDNAAAAGDLDQVAVCNTAVGSCIGTRLGPDGLTDITAARAECVRVINNTRAQDLT